MCPVADRLKPELRTVFDAWARDFLKPTRVDMGSPIGNSNLGFGISGQEKLGRDTSKALDKYVVVRVILHGQCSLQRKEAI